MNVRRTRSMVLGLSLAIIASGCIGFSRQTAGLAGSQPDDRALAVDVGDIDGDDELEPLVLTSSEVVTMSVCGSGCLQRESAISLDAVHDPIDSLHHTTFAVGDYNGDGIDDVAVGTALTVRVYFGGVQSATRPTGGLRADDVSAAIVGRPELEQFTDPVPGNPWAVVGPADIDDDGAVDLVLDIGSEYAYVASTGASTFAATSTFVFNLSPRIAHVGDALADVDGDGRNELLLHRFGLALSLAADVVTFGAPGFAGFTNQDHPSAFCGIDAVGDVDADGLDDVLLGGAVHLSTGSSFVSTPSSFADEGHGLITDLDRDGDGDLIAPDAANGRVTWRNGRSSGRFENFAGGLSFAVNGSPGQLVAGDLTGDGLDDILMVDVDAATARVVLLQNASVNVDNVLVDEHERPRRSISNGSPFICD